MYIGFIGSVTKSLSFFKRQNMEISIGAHSYYMLRTILFQKTSLNQHSGSTVRRWHLEKGRANSSKPVLMRSVWDISELTRATHVYLVRIHNTGHYQKSKKRSVLFRLLATAVFALDYFYMIVKLKCTSMTT